MVLTNRGKDNVNELNSAVLGSGELVGKLYYDEPWGSEMTRRARSMKDIDIEDFDKAQLTEQEQEVVDEIINLKEHLYELVDQQEYAPLATLFASRSISTHRFDRGQDLQEASEMALRGEEDQMYHDAYPSPIYRLIKSSYPGYILASGDEASFSDEDIKNSIAAIPPSQFIRMLENYAQLIDWNTDQLAEEISAHEKFLLSFPDDLFEGVLTAEETAQLRSEISAQLKTLSYQVIDRVRNPQDMSEGGHYDGYDRDHGKHSVAISATRRFASGELPKLVIHEENHGVLAKQKYIALPDTNRPENRVIGLRYTTGDGNTRNTWLDEAMTMFLEQYLYDRRQGVTQPFSLNYIDSRFGELQGYITISAMVLDLAYNDCFDLTDALRLYLGFPPLSNDKGIDSLAAFTNDMRRNILDRYGIDLKVIDQFNLDGSIDAPNLMALAYLANQRKAEGTLPEGADQYSIGDLLLKSEGDIDRFAAFFVPDEIKQYLRQRGETLMFDDPRGVRMHEAMLNQEEMLARARIYEAVKDREHDEDRLIWLYYHVKAISRDLDDLSETDAVGQILAGFAEQQYDPNSIARPFVHRDIQEFLQNHPDHTIRFLNLNMQEYLLVKKEEQVLEAIQAFQNDDPAPDNGIIRVAQKQPKNPQ